MLGANSLRGGPDDSAESSRIGGNDSAESSKVAEAAPECIRRGPTFLARMQQMPPLEERGVWPAQVQAICNLEASLADNRPRSLIQMAGRPRGGAGAVSVDRRGPR